MKRKILLFFVWFLAVSTFGYAQSGALTGKIYDKKTKEPIPFANIVVEHRGTQAGGGTTDFDGIYTIKPIQPGTYDVRVSYVGYSPVLIRGFVIAANRTEFLDIELESTSTQLEEVVVVDYKVPLISKDNTVQGGTVTSEEIAKMPIRSAASVATSVGGVFSRDGEIGSVRGQRTEGNVMYIDGIKVIGSSSLPESAIEQVSVMLGGLPAQYGDAIGGITNVTTRGPSRMFGGGLELQTSEFLDAFGYNRVGLNMTGPIFVNKTTNRALVGYFIAADATYRKDGSPLATGVYYIKDDVLEDMLEHPFQPNTQNHYKALFITKDDLEFSKSTRNSNNFSVNATGKFDVTVSQNANLTFGGSYNQFSRRNFNFYNSMFNFDNNYMVSGNTWRVYGRYTHRFPNNPESNSIFKNVYLELQADYSQSSGKRQDAELKDNLLAYGHVGQFDTYKERAYNEYADTANRRYYYEFEGYKDTAIIFTPSNYNPHVANYTSDVYEQYSVYPNFNFKFREELYGVGGLLNGQTPNSRFGGIYSLFGMPGARQSDYLVNSSNQFTANFNISGDIKNHEVKFGMTFERASSSHIWYRSPVSLWTHMYQSANSHTKQLDLENPILTDLHEQIEVDGIMCDKYQIDYNFLVGTETQYGFDRSLREAMGLPTDGHEFIDLDSYNPETYTISYYDNDMNRKTVTLSKPIDISFFSADELLGPNSSRQLASASGYDFHGNKFKGADKPTHMDFFTKKDENGRYTRPIAADEPIYMAFYIQDKFAFDDLVFNVGVRVDRYDANQPVLADPYSLYPIRTVGEDDKFTHPASMGDDYKIYVDNMDNPTAVKGYRHENIWYDAGGNEVVDPEKSSIKTDIGLIPYFKTLDKVERENFNSSFSDYKPQWSVMPRISFSFPVTDEALFYAHYDVITQRPRYANVFDPVNYFYWANESTPTFSNPDLKPEQNINYELGYKQKLTNTSSINISAFYIESRDQIQSYRFTGAYPKTYYSYHNIDFGTVKGVTLTYDLRRTGNVRLRASYTLQFANGTGSDPETSKALISSGQPNLRNLFPLSHDRRHALVLNFDFRYGEGADYNGPKIGGKDILANTGLNISMNGGSGTPYTRSSKIYPVYRVQKIIEGSYNGSRLPWSFRFDGRLDKDFTFATQKDKNGNKKNYYLNVYLQVLNILNSKNIMGVYSATGNPDDDGFLSAAEYQTEINTQINPQTFVDLYSIRVNNPYNYSSPRMIRLGVSLNF